MKIVLGCCLIVNYIRLVYGGTMFHKSWRNWLLLTSLLIILILTNLVLYWSCFDLLTLIHVLLCNWLDLLLLLFTTISIYRNVSTLFDNWLLYNFIISRRSLFLSIRLLTHVRLNTTLIMIISTIILNFRFPRITTLLLLLWLLIWFLLLLFLFTLLYTYESD